MNDANVGHGENALRAVLIPVIGKSISRNCRFEWFEARGPADCGARGWAAGPGTRIGLDEIVDDVMAAVMAHFGGEPH